MDKEYFRSKEFLEKVMAYVETPYDPLEDARRQAEALEIAEALARARARKERESSDSGGVGPIASVLKYLFKKEPKRDDSFGPLGVPLSRAIGSIPESALRKMEDELTKKFSELLCRFMKEKGFRGRELADLSGLTEQHISKMKNNIDYKPSRDSVLAIAVAMRLTLDECDELMMSAGYRLSSADMRDKIIGYFLEAGQYGVVDLNITLYEKNLPPIGNV